MKTYELTDPLSVIDALIELWLEVPRTYSLNEQEIEFRDYEYGDLTHLIELTTFGGVQGYKLAKMVQENRKRRRAAKDVNFILRPLKELVRNNDQLISQLYKARRETAKLVRAQTERKYRPRTDHPAVLAVFGEKD